MRGPRFLLLIMILILISFLVADGHGKIMSKIRIMSRSKQS